MTVPTVCTGEEFHYSTHAWTLVSAVIEKVSGEKFLKYMKQSVFTPLAMDSTGGEYHRPLLYNRARYVLKDYLKGVKDVRWFYLYLYLVNKR